MVQKPNYEVFVQQHQNQLVSSGVPSHFWPTLFEKLLNLTFDAGNAFKLLKIEYEDDIKRKFDPVWQLQACNESGIKSSDPSNIYLIDHAWTFRVDFAKAQLHEIESLRIRMANLMGLDAEEEKSALVEKIFDEMWKYCNTYSISNVENVEDRMPVWYIMDELGSAVQHNDEPNMRIVPFVYVPEQMTYSLLYPIKDIDYDEIITRDFIESIDKKLEHVRAAALLPWIYTSFSNESFEHEEVNPDYFLNGHIKESLPILSKLQNKCVKKGTYKVFTEYSILKKHLKDYRFEIVDDSQEADILWYTKHFKDYQSLSEFPEKFVNQFPFEYVLTVKDLLAVTSRRKTKYLNKYENVTLPKWLPITFNLVTEIKQFVSYFQYREEQNLDNHWIVKPFNLARGLDTHITNNINYIMRLPVTGPKIIQKYIEKPVLFHRSELEANVKFDLRYVVLLKNIKPLVVYSYKNFFIRFANKPFSLDNFTEYEKHFTVMNYDENAKLKHMLCAQFKELWELQYPSLTWKEVEDEIFKILKEVFECAVVEPPPCGISESPQSRALYAADIMLEWNEDGSIQPKLLEINWNPDCKRACDYYPQFYDDIFKLLFLDEENSNLFQEL